MFARLSRLKALLFFDETDTSADDQLNLALSAASDAIEQFCCRTFKKQSHTEERSGTGSKFLTVRNYPITGTPVITADTVAITDFKMLENGILFRSCGWPRGDFNVSVKYDGGYDLPSDTQNAPASTLPESIEQACLILARMIYTGEWGKDSERMPNGYAVTFSKGTPQGLPPVVEALIGPHKGRLV